MSLLDILKLVGFAMGAALHLYIALLIWNRRLGSRQGLTLTERTFLVLGVCMGVWFAGNLLTTLHGLLLGPDRLAAWLRVSDAITIVGIALPPALLHAHIAFWSSVDNHRLLKPRHVRIAGLVLYLPLVGLPYALYLINTGEYQPFLIKLRPLLIPYSMWFLFALWSSAAIDWAIKDRFDQWSPGERSFFKRLALLLFVTGALEFIVVGVRGSQPDDPLWVTYVLLSLLPTFAVAYHVYRYKIVEIAIKGSLVYAAFAMVFIAVYTYGVRYLVAYLVERYRLEQPAVIEAILILGMVALAGPLRRVIDRMVHRLFAREMGLYRDVVRQVSSGASGFGELDSLVRYTQETIRLGLDLKRVEISPFDAKTPPGPRRRLAEKMIRWGVDVIDMDEDLAELDATTVYALKREGELIGLMIVAAEPHTLTGEKRAILEVLAGQVAVEVESCRLVEEKVRLERELAHRERLATLGQMAATVAHEVKNPLSSIKSIAQVMREEEALAAYDRDLALIVSEIDRLNRTVSQLLAFSRPSNADPRPVPLAEMLESTAALLGNEARERGVAVSARAERETVLTGAQAAAVREALSNLLLNAIQAAGNGGEVAVEATIEASAAARPGLPIPTKPLAPRLVLSVTDTGPGIPDKDQARVFEPFYTTKSRGTGLGLAIVQRRAAELGGSVELTSPVLDGRGTRFRLIVPLAPVTEERLSAQA
jgi:signal transduction histidine kinase